MVREIRDMKIVMLNGQNHKGLVTFDRKYTRDELKNIVVKFGV